MAAGIVRHQKEAAILTRKPDDNYWFPFEPAVWLVNTRILSPTARGIWIDICAYAYTSPERGVLLNANGCVPDASQMQRLCNCNADTLAEAVKELLETGVAESRADGAIYCRRMVKQSAREAHKSKVCSRAANARWDAERMRNDGQSEIKSKEESKEQVDKKEKAPPSDDGRALAVLLTDSLRREFPTLAVSKLTGAELERHLDRWAREFDQYGRLDSKTRADYEAIVVWALADEFWRGNIQSPGSLRTIKRGQNAKVWVQFSQRGRVPGRKVDLGRYA